jgi:solute carrier family 12 sodium/potassium/chloride transporter 2
VKGDAFGDNLIVGVQALGGAFFRPNILFLPLPDTEQRERDYQAVLRELSDEPMGTVLYARHPDAGIGQREQINIWISDRSPDWEVSMDIGNLDLPLLLAYKLRRSWDAHMRLLTVVEEPAEREPAHRFLETVTDLARMPDTEVMVNVGNFQEHVLRAPQADLSFFGLAREPDFAFMRQMMDTTHSSCLFVRDSGQESALA